MKSVFNLLLVLCACALPACSDVKQRVPVTGEHAAFIGTWMSKQSWPAEGKADNAVLIINADSSGMYHRCEEKEWTRVNTTTREHSHSGATGGFVSAISDKQITLSINLPLFEKSLSYNLDIDRKPYQQNGQWYLGAEGRVFRKLGPDETSDHEQWPCLAKKPDEASSQK